MTNKELQVLILSNIINETIDQLRAEKPNPFRLCDLHGQIVVFIALCTEELEEQAEDIKQVILKQLKEIEIV